ncbi:GDP-mannose 4,6-dehydratase [bacterium]|nr:GDP-mannose 4,6-dehydratase [bacterium]
MPDFRDLNVFLTGGAGFIGSHTVDELLKLGARVVCLDNFDPYYDRAEKVGNLEFCSTDPRFELIEGDIRDSVLLRHTLRRTKPNIIVHLAARAGVRPSLQDPAGYADVNVQGTAVLLEAAREEGIRDFVFASSSSVYGNQGGGPLAESLPTDTPLSPYGATKKAGEVLCHSYHHVYGMSVACLRFFTVYGPRQRPDLAIRKFVRLALDGEPIPFFGDGSSRRDYTHISDILTGILGAIRWARTSEPRYGIFNLGSAHPISLSELVNMIERSVGQPVQRQMLPLQPGDVFQTYADTSLAEAELGFRHEIEFEDGLREFVRWMIEKRSSES